MKNCKTAILIFANSAEKEATLKPFQSSKALYHLLNSETHVVAEKTGLPYFHYSEKEQVGHSFGERFTNAITSVFNKGFENVIAIGNDTPHLTKAHILKAEEKLRQQHCVLGPSKDGGFYLMGLRKSHFKVESFLKLPWQTNNLTKAVSTKVLKSNNIKACFLEYLQDIDTYQDIQTALDSTKTISITLKKALSKLLFVKKEITSKSAELNSSHIHFYNFNKGSPRAF